MEPSRVVANLAQRKPHVVSITVLIGWSAVSGSKLLYCEYCEDVFNDVDAYPSVYAMVFAIEANKLSVQKSTFLSRMCLKSSPATSLLS